MSQARAYTAPALEKGLDILEMLAGHDGARSLAAMASELGRSKSEIFRMVTVLVERGYIDRDVEADGYVLTNRLFDLGIRTPRVRDLLSEAVPAMTRLASEVGHSPHLVVIQDGETVVIAAVPGRSDMSFTLRLGYRRPSIDATSGRVIIAFQNKTERRRLIKEGLAAAGLQLEPEGLEETLNRIRADGFELHDSHDFVGITDICCPIVGPGGNAVAGVIVACVQRYGRDARIDQTAHDLRELCRSVSAAIGARANDIRSPSLAPSELGSLKAAK